MEKMVYIKVRKRLVIYVCFLFCFVACGNSTKSSEGREVSSKEIVVSNEINYTIEALRKNMSQDSCLQQVMNKLQNKIPEIKYDSSYCTLSKKQLLNLGWISKEYINEYYEITRFTEAYELKLNNRQYLVILGQPAGATGIGVGYKEYKCFESDNNKPILEFSSLYGGPFSIFYNEDLNNIGYWELTKEFQICPDSISEDACEYKIMLSAFTNGNCIYNEYIAQDYISY